MLHDSETGETLEYSSKLIFCNASTLSTTLLVYMKNYNFHFSLKILPALLALFAVSDTHTQNEALDSQRSFHYIEIESTKQM